MRADIDIPDHLGAAALDAALEGLVLLGVAEMNAYHTQGDPFPPLYESGVVYEREHGTERWLTPSQVLGLGRADCEDLASYRAAEMRTSGEDPGAMARVIRSGPRTWHAIVERSDGSIEDPSRVLGMGAESIGSMGDWAVSIQPQGRGWVATITRDGAGVSGAAPYAHDALARACDLAERASGLGFIPGMDIIARAAQGALQAAVPGLIPAAPTAPVAPLAPIAPAAPAYGALPDDAGISAASRHIARQISRIATTEARRKLREASTVSGRR